MNAEMSAAIFGLVGVAIGGTITFATTVYGLRHQARASEAAERRDDARRAQIAARLVFIELEQVTSRLKLAVEKRKTWSPRFALPSWAWEEHKETLALHLSLTEWTVLAKCFQTVARLEAQAEGARVSASKDRPPMSDFRESQALLGIDRAERATVVLDRFLIGAADNVHWDDLVGEEDESVAG